MVASSRDPGSEPSVLLVGAGLGGLAASSALSRRNIVNLVLEQAPRLEQIQVGIGMVLWPNGMHALHELGVADRVAAEANKIDALEFFRADGKLLRRFPVDRLEHAVGSPAVSFLRSRLHKLLAEEVEPQSLRLGARCESFTQDEEGIEAVLADGEVVRGEVLVAADGVHSHLRERVFGLGRPAFPPYRYMVWHAVVPFPDLEVVRPGVFYLMFGRGVRFNAFRVDNEGGEVYWGALAYVDEGFEEEGDTKDFLSERYRAFASPVPELLRASETGGIHRLGIYGEQRVEQWGDGRFTLLGDAAHPLTTVLGQGAGQALEDAIVLSQSLSGGADLVSGLREYERRRMQRTTEVINMIAIMSSAGAQETPFRAWVRDEVLIRRLFGLGLGRRFERMITAVTDEF